MPNTDRLAAVIVTHNPPEGFAGLLGTIGAQVGQIVVVDNASTSGLLRNLVAKARMKTKIEVRKNRMNLGVASALNKGMLAMKQEGFGYALALDQDARPAENMVAALLEAFQNHPRRDELAIVAPRLTGGDVAVDARYVRRIGPGLFRRVQCRDDVVDNVTLAVTSGSLINLDAYEHIGPFREDFFIDYVDTEYCLRAQAHGYRIAVACNAILYHRLGDRRHRRLAGIDFYPTFHSPERWYYIARNRIPMIRMYALRFPHWFTYEIVASTYGLLRMLLFEDRRREKVSMVLRGTLDGLLGRLGPGPLGAK